MAKIIPFTFSCDRDLELFKFMHETIQPYINSTQYVYFEDQKELNLSNVVCLQREPGYGNGGYWQGAFLKFKALREIVSLTNPADDDYVLSADSDTAYTSGLIFEPLSRGLCGVQNSTTIKTKIGEFAHMSGAAIFIRGDAAKKIAQLTDLIVNSMQRDFVEYGIAQCEDILLSYLAIYCGADTQDLMKYLHQEDPQDYYAGRISDSMKQKSLFHFNYFPTTFLGQNISGKWDIPQAIKNYKK